MIKINEYKYFIKKQPYYVLEKRYKGGYFLWREIKKLIVQLQVVNTMMMEDKNVNQNKLSLHQLQVVIQNSLMNLCVVVTETVSQNIKKSKRVEK